MIPDSANSISAKAADMNETIFDKIEQCAHTMNVELDAQEMAHYASTVGLLDSDLSAIYDLFEYLKDKKVETVVNMLLRTSRLPLKEKKSFENFDFSLIHGKEVEKLQTLSTLSAIYARKNLAFIGPQGVGKTHLAMAFGRKCCEKGLKTYFLKASELNQKLLDSRRYGREGSTVTSLLKPSCLIIDEIGRCVFDKENTRLFFDIVDRRYNKDGPNSMIFTSNKNPDKWGEYFSEDSSLLCALDRMFDNATVFLLNGDSYRGKNLETINLEAGKRRMVIASQTDK